MKPAHLVKHLLEDIDDPEAYVDALKPSDRTAWLYLTQAGFRTSFHNDDDDDDDEGRLDIRYRNVFDTEAYNGRAVCILLRSEAELSEVLLCDLERRHILKYAEGDFVAAAYKAVELLHKLERNEVEVAYTDNRAYLRPV